MLEFFINISFFVTTRINVPYPLSKLKLICCSSFLKIFLPLIAGLLGEIIALINIFIIGNQVEQNIFHNVTNGIMYGFSAVGTFSFAKEIKSFYYDKKNQKMIEQEKIISEKTKNIFNQLIKQQNKDDTQNENLISKENETEVVEDLNKKENDNLLDLQNKKQNYIDENLIEKIKYDFIK